jgi:3-oxoacyl-[acyl-carrier protein] reductase
MELGLSGKVGVITGASRGIGAETARELAREGCSLVLAARGARDLNERVREVRDLGGRALACPVDLRESSAQTGLVAAAVAEFGRIDFLVCNAGNAKLGDFLDLADEDWQNTFALKFFGHVRLIRAAWPQLKASRGSIVIIAGIAGRTPGATGFISGSVNSALLNFTKAIAARSVEDGIQVNAINPGPIRTGRFADRLRKVAQARGIDDAQAEQQMVAEGGVTRIGEPEDIAGLITFILSRRGSYLHGALIDMDGGKTRTL